MYYTFVSIANGIVVAQHNRYTKDDNGYHNDGIDGIWILSLDGETLYRGELPVAYREKYTGENHYYRIDGCWATKDELITAFCETYLNTGKSHGDERFFDFIKYEITSDGLVEIPLASCRQHYSDEGW